MNGKVSIGLNRSIADECDERDLKKPGKEKKKKRAKKNRNETNDDQDGNGYLVYERNYVRAIMGGNYGYAGYPCHFRNRILPVIAGKVLVGTEVDPGAIA